MDELKYRDMVRQLKKKGHLIVEQMTPDKADLLHMAVGVAGEGGELLDQVKRHTIYDKDLDRANVVEELGDLEFFLEGVRQNLGITREETLQANFDKLGVRYVDHQYSDEQAHLRRDKVTS
jgi:NTP pyrophosphatase (non-canonical NTP hydrolase)